MSGKEAQIGTVAQFEAARAAADAAREAIKATCIDEKLIEAFEDAVHLETCASLCLDQDTRLRLEQERHEATLRRIKRAAS